MALLPKKARMRVPMPKSAIAEKMEKSVWRTPKKPYVEAPRFRAMKFCTRKEIPCMIKLAQAMKAPIFMLFTTAGTS